ncbi:PPOX class F420-dependent oxidoreductase [Streptomyces radicis]|uniref:PPOX class F420-dependent oxidoreductase n=1 Tax=Streptomyces radicis TaxID=1750517 RepID=A0A3A9W9A0_9ACTN|nr:PPOX class F420-dependent oxidoreductase [Streptomyces radicis]RKN09718.1 PPOX class F420-dependent oxidoreductase [Streptomyces radicis]RKN23356.1 PPOX class F420-dependent oxidoreductase [Streptomyces radicis]
MAVTLPEGLKAVLDGKVFVTVATIQRDGSPQLTPVWVKRDGDDLLISTTVGRSKERNLRRDPRVTVQVLPAEAPYSYATVYGTAELTTEGGQELIDDLALKYVGAKYAEFNPSAAQDAPRVVVRVTAERIVGQGIV